MKTLCFVSCKDIYCRCTETIVGVNKYRLDKQEEVEVLEIDNSKVRDQQIARINNIRKSRDNSKVHFTPCGLDVILNFPLCFSHLLLRAEINNCFCVYLQYFL